MILHNGRCNYVGWKLFGKIHSYGVLCSVALTSAKFSIISFSGNGFVLLKLTDAFVASISTNLHILR